MSNSKYAPRETLRKLIEAESIEELSADQLLLSFVNDNVITSGPAQTQLDPRNGEPTIFNTTRSFRPHDYPRSKGDPVQDVIDCPICRGNTTGILDWIELSNGFSFINKNLYPVINIPNSNPRTGIEKNKISSSIAAEGLHFLQWTSSYHDQDWHNIPLKDSFAVMTRLAALEKKLLETGTELSSRVNQNASDQEQPWFVSIFKNVGLAVGGSLEHGHQQIMLGNLPPRRILNNKRFQEKHKITFSSYLLDQNPKELTLKDYGSAILLVPVYMRRPYDMILVLKENKRSYLHDMNKAEVRAVAQGWMDATKVFWESMPGLSKEVAFNIVTHNGPGAGLYFEFLPFTQEQGGLEHLGLSVCQADVYQTAEHARSILDVSSG